MKFLQQFLRLRFLRLRFLLLSVAMIVVACATPSETSNKPAVITKERETLNKTSGVKDESTAEDLNLKDNKKVKAIPLPQLNALGIRDHWRAVPYQDISGWESDDHKQVWEAFNRSCRSLRFRAEWNNVCDAATQVSGNDSNAVKRYFEIYFQAYAVMNKDGSLEGLITGYYEPVLHGSRTKRAPYIYPVYRTPNDLLTIDLKEIAPETANLRLRGRVLGQRVVPYFNRAEITSRDLLADFELVWLNDPVDAFFMEVQGSGRVYLVDEKKTIRIGYANQNGQVYRSIGRYLVDKGELNLTQASAQSIRSWAKAHPERLSELLNSNPSMVFFEEKAITDDRLGPIGASGVNLTAARSIAVDPLSVPLDVPVFLSTTYPNKTAPLRQLMMAQDTGGAIRGNVRADFFWGTGDDAGNLAGKMKQQGLMWVLMPRAAPKEFEPIILVK